MFCSDSPAPRYLALFLPWLPAERIVGAGLVPAGAGFALIAKDRTGGRITALSCAATRCGIEVGMTLAEARAVMPGLLALAQDTAADRALLAKLAQVTECWGAQAVADRPADLPDDFHATRRWGLVLEITGLAQDHAVVLRQILAAIRSLGLTVAGALGDTPDAARALARFHCDSVRALPLAALGLSEDGRIALRRAGLHCVGELADQPRGGLAMRFGPDLARRLGRLLGEDARCGHRQPEHGARSILHNFPPLLGHDGC